MRVFQIDGGSVHWEADGLHKVCSPVVQRLFRHSLIAGSAPPAAMGRLQMMVVVLMLLVEQATSRSAIPYTQCSSSEQLLELTKASYPYKGNATVWGECNLPNPRRQWLACGRPGPSWICDPDGLLSTEDADALDMELNRTALTSVCRCEDACPEGSPRHATVLVVVNWARVPNLASVRSCEYGCAAQVFPQLRPGSRAPSNRELDMTMDRITDHMLITWGLGRCDDEVVIFYSKRYNRIHVKAGSIAAARLRSTIHKALDAATPYFAEGDLKGAFSTIIGQYYQSLGHTTSTFQVIGIVVTIIVGAIILFGVVVTVLYCRSELAQGKTCKQVCFGTMGGHWAVLFGGGKPVVDRDKVNATITELRNLEA